MSLYYGNLRDTTDFSSNRYLQINSCGFQHNSQNFTVIRESGRGDYQLLLIESGEYVAEKDGKKRRLNKGDILIYKPFEMQWYSALCDSVSLWCHFTGDAIEEILEESNISDGIIKNEPNKSLSEAFSTLIRNFHKKGNSTLTSASFLSLLHCISELKSGCSSVEGETITVLLDFINKNYSSEITLDTLARHVGYSKSRVSHVFADEIGSSPMQYLTSVRLSAAEELLCSTTLSVSKIAESCGFNDPLYFSKCFKKNLGVSPTSYRESLT